jgi:alanine-alpha-ketoisovalerate/valine-pyruvate aminotransferase
VREKALPSGFNSFYKYLINVHGGIMSVGKHKGRFFDEILADAPDYCQWALSLQAPSDCFLPFVAYSRAHLKDGEMHPAKKQRAEDKFHDATDKVCAICCDRHRDSVLVPCGHIVACMPCGLKFDDQNCPICKQYVSLVLKTYTV